jgi:lipid II:glycine glycyltransferase (peptidoglycan interpeptide bridge formation enzyme)
VQTMKAEGIVCNFVRYHTVLANAAPMKTVSDVIDLGKTVALHLDSPEVIWQNIVPKNRNMIRKAEKNGIEIHHAADMALFKDFVQIYNATMDKDHAEAYYYFGDEFYESIHKDLDGHYEMFYATYEGKIIAMSIMLFVNKQMHYHLSGSVLEYRNLAPSNLLLYKAALWGCEHGYKTLHLGGGVGSGEDNLYKFKAAFNRESDYQFSIAKMVFDQEKYDALVAERAERDPDFNSESKFFPLYRS